MPNCGECKNYFFGSDMAQGFCKAQATGETTYKFVMYHSDSKMGCGAKLYVKLELEKVQTDDTGEMYSGESFRRYAEFDHKKVDKDVIPDKTKDERAWG